ncbi:TetR/AcrR family transcriptional regulator [Geomicrobium sediminis]|uniref:AcrR family transcriptional regulator n=1 Tax=Geomicrobium sediminis TaxID=1347788 RepID=A0ABS2PDF7_9BACL|nr:TetR/AcrR family transcriptional regulator [Geomicrobium sediminis]MBM7633371.1 AcrR family transcriptional regulator [Geomicrobium sediminis]
MPKIVDHEKRKQIIAETTWKLISKYGIQHATSRNIAKEAGLSQGALRHYFSKQEGLYVFALNLVKERFISRLERVNEKVLAPIEKAVAYLLEFVPTNEETRLEMEVWFAFVAYGKTQEDFDLDHVGLEKGVKDVIVFLRKEGYVLNHDPTLEEESLYAFINGMALNLYLEPSKINRDQSKKMITHYVQRMIQAN